MRVAGDSGDIIDLMVRMSRCASASIRVAAVLGGLAGAVALPVLRRWLREGCAPVGAELAEADSTASTPKTFTEDGDSVEDGPGPSRVMRMVAFARRGLTATVVVLAVLGAASMAYAFWILPDTAIPRPGSSSIEIDFSTGHPAISPITVGMQLMQERLPDGSSNSSQVVLAIDLTGADFTRSGWSMTAIVPAGVHINGAQGNDLRTGRVARYPGSDKSAFVSIIPGPAAGGTYAALLIWNDLHSGPMQVQGANLAATFPDVTVDNRTSAGSDSAPSVAEPRVAVTRELVPFGDFAYLGGLPPDHLDGSGWSWKAATFPVNGGTGVFSYGLDVEAQSATADAQSNDAEFKSGIAFGIAAAALIAAIQEFVKSASRKLGRAHGAPGHRRSEASASARKPS